MAGLDDLKPYARGNTRNKIVLCNSQFSRLHYVDVGYELATLLRKNDNVEDADTLCRQLFSRTWEDECIGTYIALSNIGILFEPTLRLNIRSLFEQYSIGRCLIVKAEGSIENNTFLFFGDSKCRVDLEGLSYKCIN